MYGGSIPSEASIRSLLRTSTQQNFEPRKALRFDARSTTTRRPSPPELGSPHGLNPETVVGEAVVGERAQMLDYAQARRLMVDCQLRTFDVNDVAVLDAFDTVSRERFVPHGREDFAYIDQALRLGPQRVMPAPMLLARLIQALAAGPGQRFLDVGAGYGYGAAILGSLGAKGVALEPDPALAAGARERLADRPGVTVMEAPLDSGAADAGPFDAILVNGRVEVRPQTLLDLLSDGGRLACVMGRDRAAKATLFVRAGAAFGSRPLFDATLPALPEFTAEAGFAF